MRIYLHINGLTQNDLREEREREEWLKTAKGKTIELHRGVYRSKLMLRALVDGVHVGNVERSDVKLGGRALDGMQCDMLEGTIVRVEKYLLTVVVEVERLAEPKEVVSQLKDWDYTGPLMDLTDQMGKLTLIMNILKNLLKEEGASEEKVAALVRQLYELTAYDFSDDAVEERSWLIQRLEELDGERYEKALGLLHERGQRLGGKHGRAEAGNFLKHELPTTYEALMLLDHTTYETDREEVLGQARQLPNTLLRLWQTDEVAFAQTLYDLKPSREELCRVLSCLIWLDMTQGGEATMNVREVTDYCKGCVNWDEARPVVMMMQTLLQGRLSDEENGMIDEVQKEFRRRETATMEISETLKGTQKTNKTAMTRTDEEIKAVLEALMEAKDEEGNLLFQTKRQWWAVYRVLTKYCDYPKQMTSFINKIKELNLKNVEASREINYDSLRKTVEDVPKMSCDPSSWLVLRDISPKYQLQYVVADFLLHELELLS